MPEGTAVATAATNGQTAQGQTPANQSGGISTTGSQAPVVSNTPPAAVETPEQKATREAEAIQVAQKQAADKKLADEAAAKAAAVDPAQVQNQVEKYDMPKTGDRGLDAALDMCVAKGMSKADMIEAFGKMQATGNVEDINYQFLVNKLGEGQAAVTFSAFKAYAATAAEGVAKITKAASDAVGGDTQWAQIKTWFQAKEKADANFPAAQLRKLLHQGGLQTTMTAQHLLSLYKADPESKGLGNAQMQTGTGQKPGEASMSKREYVAALEKANKAGDQREYARVTAAWRAQNGR